MLTCIAQISLRTFAENVINLAVENCLVCDIHNILTPGMVNAMDEEKLRELAAESEEVQTERSSLNYEVQILRNGLQKCQRSRPHERTG